MYLYSYTVSTKYSAFRFEGGAKVAIIAIFTVPLKTTSDAALFIVSVALSLSSVKSGVHIIICGFGFRGP